MEDGIYCILPRLSWAPKAVILCVCKWEVRVTKMALNYLNVPTLLLSFGTGLRYRSIKISAIEGMSSLFSLCGPKTSSPSCSSQRINLSRANNAKDVIQPVFVPYHTGLMLHVLGGDILHTMKPTFYVRDRSVYFLITSEGTWRSFILRYTDGRQKYSYTQHKIKDHPGCVHSGFQNCSYNRVSIIIP